MEVMHSSENSLNIYQITRRNIPKVSTLNSKDVWCHSFIFRNNLMTNKNNSVSFLQCTNFHVSIKRLVSCYCLYGYEVY
jgi:hypothetical protein